MVFLTFFGYSRANEHVEHHIHDSPPTMTVPLIVLAVLSIVGGWVGVPHSLWGSARFEKFLEPVLAAARPETAAGEVAAHASFMEYFLMALSIADAGAVIWLAY